MLDAPKYALGALGEFLPGYVLTDQGPQLVADSLVDVEHRGGGEGRLGSLLGGLLNGGGRVGLGLQGAFFVRLGQARSLLPTGDKEKEDQRCDGQSLHGSSVGRSRGVLPPQTGAKKHQ